MAPVEPALVGAGASGLCANSSRSLLPRRISSLHHSPGVVVGRAKPLAGGLWVRLSPAAHKCRPLVSLWMGVSEWLRWAGTLRPSAAQPPAVPAPRPWGGLQGEALSISPGNLEGFAVLCMAVLQLPQEAIL